MSFLNSFDISVSGLTAQRQRLDTVAENIANACGNMDAEKAYILKHINYTKQK